MLWMHTFCFYCSVRLGVVASAVFSLLHAGVSILLLVVWGAPLFQMLKQLIDRDEQDNINPLIRRIVYDLANHTTEYVIILSLGIAVHIVACVMVIYGALKLQRIFLTPYMVTKFLIFLLNLLQHIANMIILKRVLNLGLLIGLTLAGGFYILFVGYSWTAAVAMYQIIELINSQKYKALYGEDPMAPREMTFIGRGDVHNVKVLQTPNGNEVSAIKRKRRLEEQQQARFGKKIISVVPFKGSQEAVDDPDLIIFNNWQWHELVGPRKGFK